MTTYPDKLDFVNVITFTDGLDNGSTGRSALNPIEDQTFDTEAEYASYVDNQIDSRTIGGKSITAYSVGVRGEDIDVSDLTKFQNNLQNIASPGNDSQGNPYAIELTDFSKLQATFTAIADSLQVVENTSTNFNMKTTLLSSGTKVRMTFDVTGISSSDAMGSSKYIEGSITRTGTGASLTYTFNNITYSGGLGSDQNAGPITGVIDGSEVTFAFTGMSGYIPATDESRAKQWAMAPSTATWQVNSEYSISGATDTQVEKRSAIIYLVLDASTSLSAPQIGQIRTAAIGFINSIYSRLSSSASVSLITNQWYTNSFTSSSQTHTYQFYATAGTTYRIAWDDSYEGSGAYTCDVKVSASGAGITPFSDVDTAYSTPRTITPSSSGNITITVIPFSSGGTGSYRIIRGY
jgi:hypothetical protein